MHHEPVTSPRTIAAVEAGKAASLASRLLRRGGGTALPGLVAERVDPNVAANLGRTLGRGRLLITGTNGKTTTSRMVASVFEQADIPFIHNREGSNLMRGIASTLLQRTDLLGRLPSAPRAFGLFETDEATLPAAAAALAPRALVFTNLFRDQLDRYGEVDTVAGLWRKALAASARSTTLVLNADDPSVAEMAVGWTGPVHWFGLDDPAFATNSAGAFDARWCGCGGNYAYERRYFAHVGWWRCTSCERKREVPQTSGTDLRLGLDSASFEVSGVGRLETHLTGLYNIYNALAAIALCRVLEVPERAILRGVAAAQPAFGRQEVVDLEGRKLRLLLAKNPAGANQVLLLLRSIAGQFPNGLNIALLLNDRFADGQDVSWIWDVDHELLAGSIAAGWAGGDRAEDLAVRMKYAGWPEPAAVERQPATLLDAIIRDTSPGDEVFVIPTYTAMRDLREELHRRGAVAGAME